METALIGGLLIGTASALLWVWLGRVAGISGILGGLLAGAKDRGWRLAFLAGMIAAPLIAAPPPTTIEAGPIRLVIAGLLVGIGTRMGKGCTSGHGVCGLARLSQRSLVAVGLFMAAAVATTFITRHGMGG